MHLVIIISKVISIDNGNIGSEKLFIIWDIDFIFDNKSLFLQVVEMIVT